jgi:N-methylhydantoinase A
VRAAGVRVVEDRDLARLEPEPHDGRDRVGHRAEVDRDVLRLRDHPAALVAYGGAGPLHACALAEELGMEAVLVPAAAGVLSALGLAAGDERRDHVVSHVRPLGEVSELPAEGEADLRYRGQSFELTVPLGGDLAGRFHRAHEERYGYADRGREVELVAVRTAEVMRGPELELPSGEPRRAAGPALVELDGSTLWIPPGWEGVRDGAGWVVTRE